MKYKQRVKSILDDKNYEVLGECLYSKHIDVIKLRCTKDGHTWRSTLNRLFAGHGCAKCFASRSVAAKSVEKMVQTFPEGIYDVSRSDRLTKQGHQAYFEYKCLKCSTDTFVSSGLCRGIFENSGGSLRLGQKSCRCSKNYSWSKEQREYQIKEKLVGSNWCFTGWMEPQYSAKSKVVIKCELHGEWDVSVDNFMNKDSRCPSCSATGFDPTKPSVLYVLDVGGANKFTGFGISNKWEDRLVTHKRNISSSDSEILQHEIIPIPGQSARFIENQIMQKFSAHPQKIPGFKREATLEGYYHKVIKFVKSLLPILPVYEVSHEK